MTAAADAALYRKLLGPAWDRLPDPIRSLHDIHGVRVARGMAVVDRGTSLLSRIVVALVGFPPAGSDVPVTVSFRREGEREIWTRDFGGRTLRSTIMLGRGRFAGLQQERMGPFSFGVAVVFEDDRLTLTPRVWSAFGIPMPRALLPHGNTYEHAADGRFNFHVEIALPLAGLIVRYRGWLVPEADSEHAPPPA